MPRPQRMTAEEEKDLKILHIEWYQGYGMHKTPLMLVELINQGLNPQQIQYYINKFHLNSNILLHLLKIWLSMKNGVMNKWLLGK